LIAFLAGLVDTDGSVTVGPDTLTLRITMQAKEVLQVAEYALLALWNVQPVWKTDRRSKYKNGPCYNLVVRNPHDSRLVIKELTPHLVTPHKRWQDSFADIGGKRSSATHVTLTWGANKRRVKTYDIEVEHPSHLYVLANGLVTHNSGKSTAGSRMVAWWFMENHPYMERPETWQGPLQILVVGRLGEQMDSELWAQKIKPLLPGGSYKETRIGGMLQRVTNTRNGNRIIFLSHHDAMNAREKVQAFTAHVVWLDEMPDHAGLVTELLMRTLTTGGRLYATFTPLLRNQEIFRLVTQPHPSAKYHKFLMLDNPIFKGKEAEVQAQVRAMCTSEAEYRARLYGEWWEGDARVTRYLPDLHRTELPGDYHAGSWRHLAVLDPAASGLAGLTVWGESPSTGVWYAVRAKYFRGTAAYDLLDSVEAELQGLGHLTRWCDCNPAGFYKEAARRGIPWKAYTEKNDRKHLTLDAFNARLLEGKLKLTPGADALGEELLKAEWAPGGERILNASSYHLLDTARYAADVLPPFAPNRFIVRTQDQEIRAQWKAKKEREQAKAATRARILERRPKWLRRPLSSLRLT
jgi:phage terminase large subunit-like protein